MNNSPSSLMEDVHWIMDTIQYLDVGLVILDRQYNVRLWNAFMQNHSGKAAADIVDTPIFDHFPEVDQAWFERKAERVLSLKNSAFTVWQQRPFVFRFDNYRPITGVAKYMYQNTTFIPLKNIRGEVDHFCVIVYDMTDNAVNRIRADQAIKQMNKIRHTDPLTGLMNEEGLHKRLDTVLAQSNKDAKPYTLLKLDIDNLKQVNQQHGRFIGDGVLIQIAEIVAQSVRGADVSARISSDEFALVLVGTDAAGAQFVCNRIFDAVANTPFTADNQHITMTVSIGVAPLDSDTHTKRHWLDRADSAVLNAKTAGGNQVSGAS